jgi:uncharacterized protein (DUF433 family)
MKTVENQPRIRLDDQGRPWIDDTNIKIIEIVLDHLGYGWNAETIQENHPHLSFAQAYAALAWYYDHQPDMDAEIARQDERIQTLRDAAAPSPLQRRRAASRRGK